MSRALGAQLDDVGARHVLLLEVAHGFLIQATTSEVHCSLHVGASVQRSERLVTGRAVEEAVESAMRHGVPVMRPGRSSVRTAPSADRLTFTSRQRCWFSSRVDRSILCHLVGAAQPT